MADPTPSSTLDAAQRRPTALVTGATSGIGRALALRLAQDGYDLVLVARRDEQLRDVAEECERRFGTASLVCPLDLAESDAPADLCHRLQLEDWPIDVLVNNAGVGTFGPFVATDREAQLTMVRLHVQALTDLTHRLLPGMLERGEGRVLNVASTAAFQPGPGMAVYFATKAYVLSLSEALHAELAPHGIAVTALCPGPTATPFFARAGMERSGLTHRLLVTDLEAVVEAGYRGLMRGRRVVVPGWQHKASAFLARRAPQRLVLALAQRLIGAS